MERCPSSGNGKGRCSSKSMRSSLSVQRSLDAEVMLKFHSRHVDDLHLYGLLTVDKIPGADGRV